MTFSETACLNALFVTILPIFCEARQGVSKRQKKALKNNAVRWELPKLGERGLFLLPTAHRQQTTDPQPTANAPRNATARLAAREGCRWRYHDTPFWVAPCPAEKAVRTHE
ncbi:unnamed protein product [Laminaria digitata]